MPSWTSYSCGKCKKRIVWEGRDAFYEIGVPYLECPKCGTINNRSNRRNEWDLMSAPKKASVYATAVLGSVFLGAGGGVAVSLGAQQAFGLEPWGSPGVWITAGVVVGFAIIGRWLLNTINDSRLRLEDESYRRTLIQLGLLDASYVVRPLLLPAGVKARTRQSDLLILICVVVMIAISVSVLRKTF
jgi:DNA-directed RNA polymerase subunit RPC12/RpoP